MLDLMPVRIVGEVSRFSFVSMVTDDDAEVRVRWRNRHAHAGRAGYVCDVHGHVVDPTACPHVLAVSWAVAGRRRADAGAAAEALGADPETSKNTDRRLGLKGVERPIDLNEGDARARTSERR